MVSNQSFNSQGYNPSNDRLSELIRCLHLRETDSYRQRLEVARSLEKERIRAINQINQLFHNSFQSYEAHWHKQSKDIREIREYLEELKYFEALNSNDSEQVD